MEDAERIKRIKEWIGESSLEDVIDTAMNRHTVRVGRRKHIAAIVREAFEIVSTISE